jgi:hypothetical protein
MYKEWDQKGSRATTRAQRPDKFIEQQTAPLFYRHTVPARGKTTRFGTEEAFWSNSGLITFASVRLDEFRLSDWFPRAPGVYWSERGVSTRENTWSGHTTNDPELGEIFAPQAKMALIEDGGIGTIRLRPRRIDGTDCWLATAVKGPQCAGGVPLALPHSFLEEEKVNWGDTVTVFGTVRFLQDAGLHDTAAYVHHASPVIIFVEKIESLPKRKQSSIPITITPVALFDEEKSDSNVKSRRWGSNFGYTFVQCAADSNVELDDAANWIEKYAKKHGGRVVTNFDERSPILSNAPLSYQRLVERSYDRTIIEKLHLAKLADRIDLEMITKYNNYGQAGAMGDNARSDNNSFLRSGDPGPPRDGKRTKPRVGT